ncbi:cyclin ccl1 [Allomyces macrogynus ATCC 38327]|uniref:Cyclin ccl1 n=1 Tax=Allomyces macrogynus (strain ATCC 38327) TaxID=578462 RepID=A0A0L0S3L2_ALLM3|nr:cyclin ccl1 [Allomyces macrogynus ATCC 38327]|eukprot:KNE56980.1 cyclin ccl1 [Allomyces macrogynus ATCC 38327]
MASPASGYGVSSIALGTPAHANGSSTPTSSSTKQPTPAPPPPLYSYSTQFRHWRFTFTELASMRRDANAAAAAAALAPLREEAELKDEKAPDAIAFVTPDEERLLVQFYVQMTEAVCKQFRVKEMERRQANRSTLPALAPVDSVWMATSITFIKRFYLYKSAIEYDPKSVMAACVFLASKVENTKIDVSELMRVVKGLDPARIKELEFTVADVLRFEFAVRHPFEAVFGLYLDLQTVLPVDQHAPLLDQLDKTRDAAMVWATYASTTDAMLVYMPSQVAMACWLLAARQTGLPFEQRFLNAPNKFPPTELTALRTILADIVRILDPRTVVKKDRAALVMRKLETCRNPLFVPDSALAQRAAAAAAQAEADRVKVMPPDPLADEFPPIGTVLPPLERMMASRGTKRPRPDVEGEESAEGEPLAVKVKVEKG